MKHLTGMRFLARVIPTAMGAVLFVLLAGLTSLFGQSLADIARQERARKAQEKKPEKVYTNDDIPATPSLTTSTPVKEKAGEAAKTGAQGKPAEGESAAGEKQSAAPTEGKAPTATKPAAGDAADAKKEPEKPKENSGDMAKLEKEYRDKFKALRDALAFEQQKLDVMQRELNLMQTQYYSDPNVAMREQTFRGQINQRTQDIEKQKSEVGKAQKAISDLEDELRKQGLPAGWSR